MCIFVTLLEHVLRRPTPRYDRTHVRMLSSNSKVSDSSLKTHQKMDARINSTV